VTPALCQATGSTAPADRDRALYATMLRLRRFEEKAGMLYALGTLATPCALGIGQEAAVAAVVDGLSPSDILIALSAPPGLELALGAAPAAVFQRLHAPSDGESPLVLLREPCTPPRLVPREEAFAAAVVRQSGCTTVLVSDLGARLPWQELPANNVLPVIMVPSDRKPEEWPLPAHVQARECEGADVDGIAAAIAAVREDYASHQSPLALVILTPPYAGHARDPARRVQAARRDAPSDPLDIYRKRLVASGRLTEAEAMAIESTVRDEIATAARAISLSCAP